MRRPLLAFLPVAAFLVLVTAESALARSRVFVVSPDHLVALIDASNAVLIERSGELGRRTVSLRRDAVRLARTSSCTSLGSASNLRLVRVRVAEGPEHAALLVGRRRPARGIAEALRLLGGASWLPPAEASTEQPMWEVEPAGNGTALGFTIRVLEGAILASARGQMEARFRVEVDLPDAIGAGPVPLILAFTTEKPPSRSGRRGRQSQCLVLAALDPADVHALVALLAATPLDNAVTRNRLNTILVTAQKWVDRDQNGRAANTIREFALEVSRRSVSEVPPHHAEAMITRALAAAEALEL